jgi:SPP1 gp7 family putative phage head morphogenesis protein
MPAKKPPEFHPTQRLQREYEQGMRTIAKRMLPPKRPEQSFQEWQEELAERSRRPDVQDASEFLARKMIKWVSIRNAQSWRTAAARSQQSRRLFRLLESEMQGATGSRVSIIIRENAALIRSIPLVVAQKLSEEVQRATFQGARAGTISKMLRTRFPELLSSRINLVSRTETAKASLALTQSRCEDLSIDFYQWATSEDQRVRASHKKMHNVIVPWSQPPDPDLLFGERAAGHYHAGGTYNCRCSQIPILTLDDITFPTRVYWHGRVSMMTKQQFKQIAVNLESRAA